jgi:hypothetical protein
MTMTMTMAMAMAMAMIIQKRRSNLNHIMGGGIDEL